MSRDNKSMIDLVKKALEHNGFEYNVYIDHPHEADGIEIGTYMPNGDYIGDGFVFNDDEIETTHTTRDKGENHASRELARYLHWLITDEFGFNDYPKMEDDIDHNLRQIALSLYLSELANQ
jgi:hypothetical protein